MMLAWSLTVVAFVLILVEVQGISSTISYNPHTIIGIIIFTTFTLKGTTTSFYPLDPGVFVSDFQDENYKLVQFSKIKSNKEVTKQ
jgi:hypothetical protein